MAFPHNNPGGSTFQLCRPAHPSLHRVVSARSAEGDHQLEKLEFALAVALSRGDSQRSVQLRDQIEALGGNQEEPGT